MKLGSAGRSIGRYAVSIDSVEAFTGIDFFPVVAVLVEEEIEGHISGEHWGLEMGEKPTTRQLDSWGQIKAEYCCPRPPAAESAVGAT